MDSNQHKSMKLVIKIYNYFNNNLEEIIKIKKDRVRYLKNRYYKKKMIFKWKLIIIFLVLIDLGLWLLGIGWKFRRSRNSLVFMIRRKIGR